MTVNFITRTIAGVEKLVAAITTSAGVADASKIVATNAQGKLDSTFLPSGIGDVTITTTAAAALAAGDFVAFNATGEAIKASNTAIATAAKGYVKTSAAVSATVTVYLSGINTLVAATPNSVYYLGTAGGATTTAPTFAVNTITQSLGYGVSTGIVFEYDEPTEFNNQ